MPSANRMCACCNAGQQHERGARECAPVRRDPAPAQETEQRAAELAIINSVQEGLASKLDMQAIYDLVGDKIHDIFDAQMLDIAVMTARRICALSVCLRERRCVFTIEPLSNWRLTASAHHSERARPLLVNNDMRRQCEQLDPITIPGEDAKSVVYVPMLVAMKPSASSPLQNMERENAFSESDVRLLETLANI